MFAEHWAYGREQIACHTAYFLLELAKITYIIVHQRSRFIHHFIYIMNLVWVHPRNGSILGVDNNLRLKSWSWDPGDFFKVKVTLEGHSAFAGSIQHCKDLIFKFTVNRKYSQESHKIIKGIRNKILWG